MYVVFVRIHVVPDRIDAFLDACADNHRHTRQEPGNHRFDVLRDTGDPQACYLYEVYDDEAAFRAHQQTDHYLRWKETVAPLMAEPRQAHKANSVLPEPWD